MVHILNMFMHLQEDYIDDKNFELGMELEKMDLLYQTILRKRQLNSRANVSYLWELIDARVEVCYTIKQDIRAVGGSSQEIPPYMIRWD
jgi:hypothetical protein